MGLNLTNQYISSSFQGLVQISGSELTDGTGSLISSLDILVSQAGTSGFATSASYATRAATLDITSGGTNDPYNVIFGETGTAKTLRGDGQLTYNPFTNILGGGATFAGTASYALTASFAENVPTVDTGSLMETGSVSFNVLTFTKADGSTFDLTVDTGSGALPFPYTGSASITGSLHVTGSQTGVLSDNEEYKIVITQSSDSTTPNILLGAQDPAMNGLNTGIGVNNVVIGSGEYTSDIKGIRSGAGDSNTVVGGWGGIINKGNYNAIIGGGTNTIEDNGSAVVNTATAYNGILAGYENVVGARTQYSAVLAGRGNQIGQIGTNGSLYGVIGGQNNKITGSDWATVTGYNNAITFGQYSAILGGGTNAITFAASANAYSTIVGGASNTISAGTHHHIIGAKSSTISSTGLSSIIAGGSNHTISGATNYGVVVGGFNNTVNSNKGQIFGGESNTSGNTLAIVLGGASNSNTGATSVIVSGENNTVSQAYAGIFAAAASTITSDGDTSVVLGGYQNTLRGNRTFIIGGQGNSIVSLTGGYDHAGGIVGGFNNTIAADHTASVILGGHNLTTTKAEEVVLTNLSVYGDTFISSSALGTGSFIDNLGQEGVGTTTSINHIVNCTQAEYDALTPDANTFYIISGSGETVQNLTVSGSLVGEVGSISVASSTGSLDCSLGNYFTLGLANAADTHLVASNIQAGQTINIKITNNATAAGTISFAPEFEFEGGTAFTATAATNAVDIITLVSFDGTSLQTVGVKNFS